MSNLQPEENENLLKSIASTVEIMRDRMATKDDLGRFATKDDLGRFVTKDDLGRFATKDDLGRFATKDDLGRFATKDDLGRFATKDDLLRFATKEDLERFATKDDFNSLREQVGFLGGQVEHIRDHMDGLATKDELARVEARLTQKIEVEITAVRGDIERVHLRLDAIEKALSSRINHIEAELSRMRSVLYLLVKDKPEMLRLLGQSPPPAGEREKSTP